MGMSVVVYSLILLSSVVAEGEKKTDQYDVGTSPLSRVELIHETSQAFPISR